MSHNILDVFSLTDYDNASELNASSYFFLPDPFQRALPTARTNPPQNNQFLDSIALTQFATLPDNLHQQLTISTIPVWKPFSAPPEKTFTIIRRPLQSIPLSSLRILWPNFYIQKRLPGLYRKICQRMLCSIDFNRHRSPWYSKQTSTVAKYHQRDCSFRVLPKFPKKLMMYLMEKENIFSPFFYILVWVDQRTLMHTLNIVL